jgi:hypothetical protein
VSHIIERISREMHDQLIRQDGIVKVKTIITDHDGKELIVDTTKVSAHLIEGQVNAQPLE